MKKSISISILLVYLLMSVFSCAKKESANPEGPEDTVSYRLISSSYYNAHSIELENEEFAYSNNMITQHFKYYSDNYKEVTDYIYQDSLVIELKHYFWAETPYRLDTTVYYFDGALLTGMKGWSLENGAWNSRPSVTFSYENGRPVEYHAFFNDIQFQRGFYYYSGGKLDNYKVEAYFEWTDHWATAYTKAFIYEGNQLIQQNSTIGDEEKKYFYTYNSGNLIRTDIHQINQVNWYHANYSIHSYSPEGNMEKTEMKDAATDEMSYFEEYGYEEGKDNFGYILYMNYQLPGMRYPKPFTE